MAWRFASRLAWNSGSDRLTRLVSRTDCSSPRRAEALAPLPAVPAYRMASVAPAGHRYCNTKPAGVGYPGFRLSQPRSQGPGGPPPGRALSDGARCQSPGPGSRGVGRAPQPGGVSVPGGFRGGGRGEYRETVVEERGGVVVPALTRGAEEDDDHPAAVALSDLDEAVAGGSGPARLAADDARVALPELVGALVAVAFAGIAVGAEDRGEDRGFEDRAGDQREVVSATEVVPRIQAMRVHYPGVGQAKADGSLVHPVDEAPACGLVVCMWAAADRAGDGQRRVVAARQEQPVEEGAQREPLSLPKPRAGATDQVRPHHRDHLLEVRPLDGDQCCEHLGEARDRRALVRFLGVQHVAGRPIHDDPVPGGDIGPRGSRPRGEHYVNRQHENGQEEDAKTTHGSLLPFP